MGASSDDKGAQRSAWRHLQDYLRTTHGLFNSMVLIIPVFCVYQIGILAQLLQDGRGAFSINGADLFTSRVLDLFGGSLVGYVVFVVFFASAFGVALWWLGRREGAPLRLHLAAPMLAESVVYALLLGASIHLVLSMSLPNSLWMKVFHAFGAGFNEEIIFRLGIFGGIVFLGRLTPLPQGATLVLAVVISSGLFSGFHYVGPYAHPLTLDSFMFRFLAGVYLATIYWWRGLAVAVYTHVIYDLYYFVIVS